MKAVQQAAKAAHFWALGEAGGSPPAGGAPHQVLLEHPVPPNFCCWQGTARAGWDAVVVGSSQGLPHVWGMLKACGRQVWAPEALSFHPRAPASHPTNTFLHTLRHHSVSLNIYPNFTALAAGKNELPECSTATDRINAQEEFVLCFPCVSPQQIRCGGLSTSYERDSLLLPSLACHCFAVLGQTAACLRLAVFWLTNGDEMPACLVVLCSSRRNCKYFETVGWKE